MPFSPRVLLSLLALVAVGPACTSPPAESPDAGSAGTLDGGPSTSSSSSAASGMSNGSGATSHPGGSSQAGSTGSGSGAGSSSAGPGSSHSGQHSSGFPDAGVGDAGALPDASVVDGGGTGPVGGDAARCGAQAYQWRTDPSLGTVLESEQTNEFSALALNLALQQLRNDGQTGLQRTPSRSVTVHRLRYQTQDRGQLEDATGLVGLPQVSGATQLPVLVFLHGTAGLGDVCAPSRNVRFNEENYEVSLVVGLLASFGYIVVAPDYLGLKSLGAPSTRLHSYLVGEPTALASVDMVRATLAFVPTVRPMLSAGPIVIDGASQGGHAAAFMTRFLPHYAPELDVRGAVWGIPPTNLVGHMQIALTNFSDPTSNTVAFALSADDWYRSSPNRLADMMLPPWNTTLPPHALSQCNLDPLDGVTSLDQVFTPELLAYGANPTASSLEPWGCYVRENSLPTTSVPHVDDIPVLMVTGEADTLVSPVVERASLETLCADGYRIAHLECAGARHTDAFLYSLDDQLDFLEDRLAGVPMPASTCQVQPATVCSSAP